MSGPSNGMSPPDFTPEANLHRVVSDLQAAAHHHLNLITQSDAAVKALGGRIEVIIENLAKASADQQRQTAEVCKRLLALELVVRALKPKRRMKK